jgi:hypothetical protein
MTRDWLDRIDHIAKHFKNGKRMSEWRNSWPEDGFEEGFDPGDDEDDGDTDKRDNINSASDKQGNPRADSGKDERKIWQHKLPKRTLPELWERIHKAWQLWQ